MPESGILLAPSYIWGIIAAPPVWSASNNSFVNGTTLEANYYIAAIPDPYPAGRKESE